MSDDQGTAVLRKVAWRLLPFLCLLYIFNILNRSNLGFNRKVMTLDLALSPGVFDIAYGLFYIGYLAFQMPANLLLRRVGARRWIAWLMVAWGAVSAATMLVGGDVSLCLMRVLLGIAQAGFFPGVILYLTFWFPARLRARATSLFMMAICISGVVGNPLSGAIVHYLDGVAGLTGWQWIFLLEGLPTVVLGLLVLVFLADCPEQAGWLSERQREGLRQQLAAQTPSPGRNEPGSWVDALTDVRVWLLIAVYSTVAVGTNAGGAHMPELIRAAFKGESELTIGRLLALPHLCALVAMILLGMSSDRTGERRWHVSFAALVAALGWTVAWRASSAWMHLTGLCMAQMGMMSMLPIFWAMPTAFLRGAAAAGGIALINSVANIGGALGPTIFYYYGMKEMAIILAVGAVLVLTVPSHRSS